VFSERDSCSANASTVTCMVFALVLVEVNNGGISCVLPLTITKARFSAFTATKTPLHTRCAFSTHVV